MPPNQKIVPHLWYSKEAEEAAAFYASVFPDSRVERVTAMPNESPSGPPGSVKIVEFSLFGLCWQIAPTRLGELMTDHDTGKVKRVGEAMLKMVKLDIAALQRAYDGQA